MQLGTLTSRRKSLVLKSQLGGQVTEIASPLPSEGDSGEERGGVIKRL